MARKIIGSVWDRLNRNAINDNFEELYGYKNTADSAKEAADYAVNTAEFAKAKAESVQAQFNQVVIEGDSSVEAAQARVGSDGTTYETLKERLDAEHEQVNTRLAQNEQKIKEVDFRLNSVMDSVPTEFGAISLEPHPLVYEPVLTREDVTDMSAKFVADPFVVKDDNVYHMFFEVADQNGTGHIGHATSFDTLNWEYDQIVLSDGNHFAYPFVFKWENEWYMLPDRGNQVPGLVLYKANNFPYDWQPYKQLFSTGSFVDSTLVYWGDVWYLFYYDTGLQQTLVKYAENLDGEWFDHPSNPFTSGLHLRPGGRPVISSDTVDIFMQDGTNGIYGEKVWQYRITELSKTTINYSKMSRPVIEGQKNGYWNSKTMHHVDIIFTNKNSLPSVLVDGTTDQDIYSIGVFTVGTKRKKPYVRLVRNTRQSVDSGVWNKIIFDRVMSDTTNSFDSEAQKYIIPESGLYIISASVAALFTNTTNAEFVTNMRILQNGLEIRSSPKHGRSSSFNIPRTYLLNDVALLQKGDEIKLEFYHASGSTVEVLNQGWSTWLTLTKVD